MAEQLRKAETLVGIGVAPSPLRRVVAGAAAHPYASAFLLLSGCVFAVFADLFLGAHPKALSLFGADLSQQYFAWRDFAARELKAGQMPFWNPYIFGGAPFFGGFQAAVLYPVNWVHIWLPRVWAVNVEIVVNIWLAGAFAFLRAKHSGSRPLSCLIAGLAYALGCPFFLHVMAGHLSNLATLAWAPLTMLGVERIMATRSWRWILPASLGLAMQVLGGHPQYVCYTVIAACLYASFCILPELRSLAAARREWVRVAYIAAAFAGAGALAAAQLLPGMAAASESVRGVKNLSFEAAASYGFPPENIATLFDPAIFGDTFRTLYVGRGFVWEACLFFGVVASLLAVTGALDRRRGGFRDVAMVVSLMVLACAPSTPLFAWLYAHVPTFNLFRGVSKFSSLAHVFFVALVARGADRWLADRRLPRGVAWTSALVALITGVAGIFLVSTYGVFHGFPLLESWVATGPVAAAKPELLIPLARGLALSTGGGLMVAATLTSAVFWLATTHDRRRPRAAHLVVALAVLELVAWARIMRPTFEPRRMAETLGALEPLLAQVAPGERVLVVKEPDLAMLTEHPDAWGYDPGVLHRYAEFAAFTQGLPPAAASADVTFRQLNLRTSIMRLGAAIVNAGGSFSAVRSSARPLPRFSLISRYEVAPNRDLAFAKMAADDFNPATKVILERQPASWGTVSRVDAAPPSSSVKVLDTLAGRADIEVTVDRPGILLVTDAYDPDWRATSLAGDPTAYEIIPANHAFMGIPLSAGIHRLRLEYRPAAWPWGVGISGFACCAWILGAVVALRRARRPAHGAS